MPARSPASSLLRSQPSSTASSKHSHSRDGGSTPNTIPVETLVNYVLAAKRSLSTMTLVLRANELAGSARGSHENASILAAHSDFLGTSILDEASILVRIRRSLQATYDWGKKDFKKLIKAMDEVDGDLERTIGSLRRTEVRKSLRPDGEGRRTLLDFVDETSVHGLRDAMKKSIQEFQSIQQSFDGDLLRFDTDIRSLHKSATDSRLSKSHTRDEDPQTDHTELLHNLVDHSSNMAQLLASLTNHFDMCVTAIRTTDGAAALARRKAAEATQTQGTDAVSISGVIAEQESHSPNLEPETAQDRAEMLKVVEQDAQEVDDVVQEMHERLDEMTQQHAQLEERTSQVRRSYLGTLAAYGILCEVGDRLGDYLAAEHDFRARWDIEKDVIIGRLHDMREMRHFYEGYATAYDGLLHEVERRRGVEERVKAIWGKARESVDKILEQDQAERDTFRMDVGEYLPGDLWAGMQGSAERWQVVPAEEEET